MLGVHIYRETRKKEKTNKNIFCSSWVSVTSFLSFLPYPQLKVYPLYTGVYYVGWRTRVVVTERADILLAAVRKAAFLFCITGPDQV